MFPGWEKYKEDAIKSRNKYNTLLKSILTNYGIQHEAEIFSGAFTKLHCRFRERKDRDEIEKVVVSSIKQLTKSISEEFVEEFEESEVKNIDVRVLQKASAWYIVTYSDSNAKLLSFPWTVSKYLPFIKVRKIGDNLMHISPIVEKMDKQIKLCESQNLLPRYTENVWQNYKFMCDPNIVKLALRVLILWAQDEGIIEKPGQNSIGLLYTKTFVDLFIHIAKSAKYLVKDGRALSVTEQPFSPALLCIEFFRFCLTLRFYNKFEVKEIVPFPIYKYNALAKKAVVSYHMFAVMGKFLNIYFDSSEADNEIEMREVYIDKKNLCGVTLEKARDILEKYSQAQHVMLRDVPQNKKVVVSAVGSEQSLKALRMLLRKKQKYLRELFVNGVPPTVK